MAWIDPIVNRSATDITNLTSKAFFNVIDWVRINGNTDHVRAMIEVLRGVNISYNDLPDPSMTSIPTAEEINQFVENIERLHSYSGIPASFGVAALKTDYVSGASGTSPDFEDVNDWEQNLAILKDFLVKSAFYEVFCGVAEVGQIRFWQNRFRVPFVKESETPVRRPRCGVAVCGTGAMRQNKYRRYSHEL